MNLFQLHGTGGLKMAPPMPRRAMWAQGRPTSIAQDAGRVPAERFFELLAGKWPEVDPEELKKRFLTYVELHQPTRRKWVTWLDAWMDYRHERLEFDFGKPAIV